MSLAAGEKLGPYDSHLDWQGSYRARDTRLHREVAIKVLPESFAAGAAGNASSARLVPPPRSIIPISRCGVRRGLRHQRFRRLCPDDRTAQRYGEAFPGRYVFAFLIRPVLPALVALNSGDANRAIERIGIAPECGTYLGQGRDRQVVGSRFPENAVYKWRLRRLPPQLPHRRSGIG